MLQFKNENEASYFYVQGKLFLCLFLSIFLIYTRGEARTRSLTIPRQACLYFFKK